jgi:hypothetical protein
MKIEDKLKSYKKKYPIGIYKRKNDKSNEYARLKVVELKIDNGSIIATCYYTNGDDRSRFGTFLYHSKDKEKHNKLKDYTLITKK